MLEQPVPNPLATNPNFHTHKVLAAVGLILIVLIIVTGGVWYFVQSAEDKASSLEDSSVKVSTSSAKQKTATKSTGKDETADWKTYSSKGLGFSVRYPVEWVYDEVPQNQGVNLKTSNHKTYGGAVTVGQNVSITIQKNDPYKPIENWWSNEGPGDYFVSDKKSFKVDGYDAIKYKVTSSGSFYGALIENSKTVYVIDVGSTTDLQHNTLEVFDNILSTFKFL